MNTLPVASSTSDRTRHPGPPALAPAVAFVVIFALSILAGPVLGPGPIPSPFNGSASSQQFFAASHAASQIAGLLMLLSSLALAWFSALAYSRLNFLAPNAPGPAITLIGGLFSATMLAVSAAIEWVLSRPEATADPAVVSALQYLMFITGGPAHTVALSMLITGLAVTSWFLRRAPRWLLTAGFAIALVNLLSCLTFLDQAAAPLIPLGRFTAMPWLITASAFLPRHRQARRPGPQTRPSSGSTTGPA